MSAAHGGFTWDGLSTFLEALAAIMLPIGGGIGGYLKYKSGKETERRNREEAARIAADRAIKEAREQRDEMTEQLLDANRASITRLTAELADAKADLNQVRLENHELLMGKLERDDK